MKHLGDISKVDGGTIAPVDIITFGSPCQDLSVAGKQAGLEGNRSGLFREAVRIITEMRIVTNGQQPRFAVWENVPGAYSSNKGVDFQTVLWELCKITAPKAPAVAIPKGGWPSAGQLTDVGGGSLAWRTIDAQFHGVPQRRRRIILVCDFTGQCAGDLLFKPRGLPGYPAPGVCEGQAPAGAAAVSPDRAVLGFAYKASPSAGGIGIAHDTAPTLLGERNDAAVMVFNKYKFGSYQHGIGTLRANPSVTEAPLVLQGSMIGRTDCNGPQGDGISTDISFTLNTVDRHAVVFRKSTRGRFKGDAPVIVPTDIANTLNTFDTGEARANEFVVEESPQVVRRLTPTECARLQGFPDWWAQLPTIDGMSDEAFEFWQEVRRTYAGINGKAYKPVKKKQMIRWYNRLHTDSAEYKMWGNGVALPVVRIPLHGMAALGARTMGSLFDGSGGFPLAGLLDGITTLWASEVEPYPIADTEWNFSGRAQLLLGGTTDE